MGRRHEDRREGRPAARLETPAGLVPVISGRLNAADHLGGLRARLGIRRNSYRVAPGLYAYGAPRASSPVLVTANYKLTVDALRRAIRGLDAWLLVVDTKGINVWCAAGKGTFCAAEVDRRVVETRLAQVVDHRRLILPQLAGPGVAAREVTRTCGFGVVFGPVRADDLPAFLAAGLQATAEMRRVTFTLRERLAVTPVELSVVWHPWMLVFYTFALVIPALRHGFSPGRALTHGLPMVGLLWLALLVGAFFVPLLLPWLPGRAFSAKGALLGAVAGLLVVSLAPSRFSALGALAAVLEVTAVASYVAMNFTGSTPFTSHTGVEREMRRALPLQVACLAVALVAGFSTRFVG